jgi:tricorn protease interacting factor F2/3
MPHRPFGLPMLEYDVDLDVDHAAGTFRGIVTISGLPEPGPVELDAVDLRIERVESEGVPVPFTLDGARSTLAVARPASSAAPLRIEYSGRAAEGIQTGLFVARLGTEKAITTQMEPESCRRLLPCLDRPDRKAVFRLRVSTQSGLTVISNMPGTSRAAPDGRSAWSFDPTPPMSSYLLYLGLGPFEETHNEDGPIRVTVAAPTGKRAQAARSAGIAREALRGFSDYYDVPYPLPKLHLVVLSDFWAGMENWGAISGSDHHYLTDESTSPAGRQYGEQAIVHEIAHQWFGDLVTMRSWDDLWLNEAFATFTVPVIQERLHLRRDPWAEFAMWTDRGDRMDSVWTTHPVKPDSYVAAEILATADQITYSKGARLIVMIESFVGHDPFRDGVSEYLRDHSFGNATSDDLWEALEEESQLPVSRIMRTWVERSGHPCVTVRPAARGLEVSQRRFVYLPRDTPEPPWPIPFRWAVGDATGSVLFDTERMLLPDLDPERTVIDPGRKGFFRLLWAPELRSRRIRDLSLLPADDRSAFVHDAYGFLMSGDYSLDDYVAILHAIRDAEDVLTVDEQVTSLELLYPVLWDVPAFARAARDFCARQRERLGETGARGESEAVDLVRDWLFWVSTVADERYARELAGRFARVDSEPPAMRLAIAAAYGRNGGPDAVPRLLERARGLDGDAARHAAIALGGCPDPERVTPVLDEALTSVRISDTLLFLVPQFAKNPVSRAALWEWLTRNLREIERRSVGSFLLPECLDRTLPSLGIGREEAVNRYFAAESFPEGLPAVRRATELLRANERLRSRIRGELTGPASG